MANGYSVYDSPVTTGKLREELAQMIFLLAQTATPGQTAVNVGTTGQYMFEWLEEGLFAAGENAQIEGFDESNFDAAEQSARTNVNLDPDDANDDSATVQYGTTPERHVNYTQIFKKAIQVTGTEEQVNKSGDRSEVSHQRRNRMLEIKRDKERAYFYGHRVASAGSRLAARTTAGYTAQLSGVNAGGLLPDATIVGDTILYATGNGNAPSSLTTYQRGSAAATAGISRAFTEVDINNLMGRLVERGMINAGGAGMNNEEADVDIMMLSTNQSLQLDDILDAKSNTRREIGNMKFINHSYEKYGSTFGPLAKVTNQFMRKDAIHIFNPKNWTDCWLKGRQFFSKRLGDTGDNIKFLIIGECGFKHHAYGASGSIIGATERAF